MTPHDFNQMTGLQRDGPLIGLKGKSSTQLSIDLLRRWYSSKSICYFNLKVDYRPYSQATPNDISRMARAFLLYILGAYLFANGGQTMSLRWLALFHDFGKLRRQAKARLVLRTCTHPWTHSVEGLYANW